MARAEGIYRVRRMWTPRNRPCRRFRVVDPDGQYLLSKSGREREWPSYEAAKAAAEAQKKEAL